MTLTDTTLCAPGLAAGEALEALYDALLEMDVLVQVPPDIARELGDSLVRDRTVLMLWGGETAPKGYAAYLCGQGRRAPGPILRECPISAPQPPLPADRVRLAADDALFLGEYERAFDDACHTLCCPAELNANGVFATALSVQWVLRTGQGCTVSFAGCEGSAPMEQVMLALHLNGIAQRTTALARLGKAWSHCFGRELPSHWPVVGSGIFEVSSGVHVDGLRKNPASYEPFPPEAVGGSRQVVLGRHAGRGAVTLRLQQLGIHTDDFDLGALAAQVRQCAQQQGRVGDELLLELAGPLRRVRPA